jgi:hypothetical protein
LNPLSEHCPLLPSPRGSGYRKTIAISLAFFYKDNDTQPVEGFFDFWDFWLVIFYNDTMILLNISK